MTIARTKNYDIIQEPCRGSSGVIFLRVVYRHTQRHSNPEKLKSSLQERTKELRTM
jgi:hypothetical protein